MNMRKISHLTFILALALISSQAFGKIKLSTDRFDIRANETFHLILLLDNQSSLQPELDTSFLPEEFRLLNKQQFNNSALVNGKFTSQKGWNLTLLSDSAGTFTLPSFKISSEQSQSFHLRVLPELDDLDGVTENDKILMRASIDLEQAYVQQQIIYTVRVYSSVPTRHRNLSSLYAENALIEKLADGKEFQMVKGDTIYKVIQEQYAIFPQKSGELIIEPVTYKANILDETSKSWNSLNRVKPISMSSARYTIDVKPKPAEALEPWLPARKLELSGQWQSEPDDFAVGKPATFDLRLKGVSLVQSQLPEISIASADGLKIYRDTPLMQSQFNRFGITSYHLEKLAVIPSAQGQLSLPEIKIPYWNTETDSQDYAILPAQSFNVAQGEQEAPLASFSANSKVDNSSESLPNGQQLPTVQGDQQTIYWQWATYILAALWLITLSLFLFRRPTTEKSSSLSEHTPSKPPQQATSIKAISVAAQTNRARLCMKLLISWAQQQPHLKNVHNLGQLIAFSDHPELKKQLQTLQQTLYSLKATSKGAKADEWNGKALSEQLVHLPKEQLKSKKTQGLPGLYD